jgi:hypothetical protein
MSINPWKSKIADKALRRLRGDTYPGGDHKLPYLSDATVRSLLAGAGADAWCALFVDILRGRHAEACRAAAECADAADAPGALDCAVRARECCALAETLRRLRDNALAGNPEE